VLGVPVSRGGDQGRSEIAERTKEGCYEGLLEPGGSGGRERLGSLTRDNLKKKRQIAEAGGGLKNSMDLWRSWPVQFQIGSR